MIMERKKFLVQPADFARRKIGKVTSFKRVFLTDRAWTQDCSLWYSLVTRKKFFFHKNIESKKSIVGFFDWFSRKSGGRS